MDLNIVEAAQAGEKFFLLGGGGEKCVVVDPIELARLATVIATHLDDNMLIPHPSETAAPDPENEPDSELNRR